MKIFPILLATIFGALMVTTIVLVGLTLLYPDWWGKEHNVLGDPWSWGKPPSKNWLQCYYSGSKDCSTIR